MLTATPSLPRLGTQVSTVWRSLFILAVYRCDLGIPEKGSQQCPYTKFSNVDNLLSHGAQEDFQDRNQIFLKFFNHFILKTNICLYFSDIKVWLFESHDVFVGYSVYLLSCICVHEEILLQFGRQSTGSCYAAQSVWELTILLPQPQWYAPPHLVFGLLFQVKYCAVLNW